MDEAGSEWLGGTKQGKAAVTSRQERRGERGRTLKRRMTQNVPWSFTSWWRSDQSMRHKAQRGRDRDDTKRRDETSRREDE